MLRSETPSEIDLLQAYAAERDVPCPGCRYNLRGLRSSHCPECGQALRLNVGLVHPKQAALIVGLIGLSAGAGHHLSSLGFWVDSYLSVGFVTLLMHYLLYHVSGLVTMTCLIFIWLRSWRRLQRFGPLFRWGLAILAWTIFLLGVLLFDVIA